MGIIQKQGIKSGIITIAGMLTAVVSLFVIQPFYLSKEEIGLTRILFSTSFLISTILPLGAGNIITRYLPKFRNDKNSNNGFLAIPIAYLLVGIGVFFPLLGYFSNEISALYIKDSKLFSDYFLLIFPFSLTLACISILNSYFFSLFKPLLPAFCNDVLPRFLFIILILIYSFGLINLKLFVYSFVLIYIIQLIILLIYLFKDGLPSVLPSPKILNNSLKREILFFSGAVFFSGLSTMGIKLVDTVIIGQFVSLDIVGIYSIAAFIPSFIEAPINSLEKISNARIAKSWEDNDIANIHHIYVQSSRFLFAIGGLLFLLVYVNTPPFFKLLPAGFELGIQAVYILSLSALFNLITGTNTAIIFTSKQYRFGSFALIAISIINILLLYALIPGLGINGAALASCISSFIYNLFKYLFIWKYFKIQPFDFITLKILLIVGFIFIVSSIVPFSANPFLSIIAGSLLVAILYFILLKITGIWNHLKVKL